MTGTRKFIVAWPLAAALFLPVLLVAAGCSQDPTSADSENPKGPPSGLSDEPGASDSLYPVVVIKTSHGEITVELNAEKAKDTVSNFLRYVDENQYDNTIFHQARADDIILGGAYTVNLIEKLADSPIFNEATNGLSNLRGTIAMARQSDVADSATSHFFINARDNSTELDHKNRDVPEDYGYCVFGKVTQGMDVVDQISRVEVEDKFDFQLIPKTPVEILSIRRQFPSSP